MGQIVQWHNESALILIYCTNINILWQLAKHMCRSISVVLMGAWHNRHKHRTTYCIFYLAISSHSMYDWLCHIVCDNSTWVTLEARKLYVEVTVWWDSPSYHVSFRHVTPCRTPGCISWFKRVFVPPSLQKQRRRALVPPSCRWR